MYNIRYTNKCSKWIGEVRIMIQIHCKELYRISKGEDFVEELIEIGRMFEKKDKNIRWIISNEDIPAKLQLSWMKEYYKEWNESMEDLHKLF